MRFTLGWLKRHLDTDATLEQICETLTAIGLEVEDVVDGAAMYAPFSVAYVESAEQHPDADKLKLCTVKSKDGVFQVVCGAPNAKAGMTGIFAPEGSYIPGLDVTLKKAKIRGVESCGMLVSEKEMLLSDEHKGIIELDDSYAVGTPMAEVFGLDDPVIEIALTPNRADCAGIYGIARDLAAAGLGTLKAVDVAPVKGDFASPVGVSIEDADGCPMFLGRTIKGVKNGPSPEWLQRLLKSVGLRPISALVDITNFMMLDHARPLHVYDVDKLSGDIAVRESKAGGALEALDDKSYEVIDGAVAICDDSGVIGMGGIIGGTSTGCTDETSTVFVEAAYFKPERIARAGRDMGIVSDARYRFERGVDPEFTTTGMDVATQLIVEICGGEVSEIVTAGAVPEWKRSIDFDPTYVSKRIGMDIPAARQEEILSSLGFEVSDGSVTPPPWRGDVEGKADLTEEVVRIVGYDHIPEVSVRSEVAIAGSAETPLLTKTRLARKALTARGLDECVTWSFMNAELTQMFGLNDNALRESLTIKNAISSEIDVMRPSILPNLIEAAQRNADMASPNVAFCEVGPVFESVKPEGQKNVAAGIRAGAGGPRSWVDETSTRAVDAYDAKADALAALEACGAPAANAQISRDAPDYFHPGRSGSIRLGRNVLAYFGEIHPAVLEQMDVKTALCGFEIFLDNIPTSKKKGTEKPYLKLEPLMPLSRDFAFIVDDSVDADDLRRSAMAADKNLITGAAIFDIYQGQGVDDGQKSVAFSIDIQPKDKTLTEEDLDALMKKVIDNVQQKTGGVLRG